jgi:hypothetical protein
MLAMSRFALRRKRLAAAFWLMVLVTYGAASALARSCWTRTTPSTGRPPRRPPPPRSSAADSDHDGRS